MDKHVLRYVIKLANVLGHKLTKTADELVEDWEALRLMVKAQTQKEPSTQVSLVRLKMLADGKPSQVQVRAFTNYRKIGDSYEIVQDGAIDFVRAHTDENGNGLIKLPTGREYLLKITKGIAYGAEYRVVEAAQGEKEITADLPLLVNLRKEGIFCGNLHHHSIYSSPVHGGTDDAPDSVDDVYTAIMASGFDYAALSDHHNILNHPLWRTYQSDHFTPIISKEISTGNGHVNAHGADADIIYQIPTTSQRTDEYLRGEFIRISDEIKAKGGLPQLNHPCTPQKELAFPENFYDIIDIFEAIEIWNSHMPFVPGFPTEKAFQLWLSLLRKGTYLPAVGGSDTHRVQAYDFHEISAEISEIYNALGQLDLPDNLKESANLVVSAAERLIPSFEEWAEECYGSGSVVNITYIDGKPTQENILDGIRKGHNVITNGPILLPTVDVGNAQRIVGEIVPVAGSQLDIKVKLLCKKPMDTLLVYTMAGEEKHKLELVEMAEGFLDYSTTISVNVQENDFVVISAHGGPANLAISNPFFVGA